MANGIKTAAIVPAGGTGTRMGLAVPKQFAPLAGKPLLVHTLDALQQCNSLSIVILVVPKQYLAQAQEFVQHYGLGKVTHIVPGGRERQDSVAAGLAVVPADIEVVAVHDGARPFVSADLLERCLAVAREKGTALAAVRVKDTIKNVRHDKVLSTVDRQTLWQAQTPQAARRDLLLKAFAMAEADGFRGTDEAALLEHAGIEVHVVEGEDRNLKMTTAADLVLAEALLAGKKEETMASTVFRIGHGYDAHRLVPDRPLILGGVTVPFEKGLLGHSDADVLTHALCDALLGAAGLGDIGRHFPDSDERYRGISSLKLLARVVSLAAEQGFFLCNADITVVAQRPKLAPYFPAMREKLAAECRVEAERINLKGTTTEEMGFTGRGEGIAAHVVALLQKGP